MLERMPAEPDEALRQWAREQNQFAARNAARGTVDEQYLENLSSLRLANAYREILTELEELRELVYEDEAYRNRYDQTWLIIKMLAPAHTRYRHIKENHHG